MCSALTHVREVPKADIRKAHSPNAIDALVLSISNGLAHKCFLMQKFVIAVLLFMAPNAAARGAEAETLQVLGQAGVLGEWELTANLTTTGAQKQFSGPLVMKHVGLCTVDGPEQKTGEIKLQLVGTSRVKATLFVDGVACAYAGRKSDFIAACSAAQTSAMCRSSCG